MPFGIVGLAVGYSYYKYYLKTKELGSYKTPLQSGVFPDGKAPNIGPAGSVWLFISVRTGISIQHFNFIFSRMLSRVAAPIARVPVRFARHVSWLFYLIILSCFLILGYHQVWCLDRLRSSNRLHFVFLRWIRWLVFTTQDQCQMGTQICLLQSCCSRRRRGRRRRWRINILLSLNYLP